MRPSTTTKSESTTKPRKQCSKCPWKVSVDPNDIPGEYSADKHCALKNTIADDAGPQNYLSPTIRVMACHETPIGREKPCVGWLVHQLGVGNNIALRLRVAFGQVDANVVTVGPQHERFEDTLPKQSRRER